MSFSPVLRSTLSRTCVSNHYVAAAATNQVGTFNNKKYTLQPSHSLLSQNPLSMQQKREYNPEVTLAGASVMFLGACAHSPGLTLLGSITMMFGSIMKP